MRAVVYLLGVSIAWILRTWERAQMTATPPEASTEYSRDPPRSRRFSRLASARARLASDGLSGAILAGGLAGALLLIVAELTTLFTVHVASSSTPIKSVGTGSHHGYALVPIALLVAALAVGFKRERSRAALLAIGALGVVALLIALIGDLPDARASGLVGSSATHYVSATATPSAGLYMETLGAVVLVITCVCGLLLLGPRASPAHLSA